ncbi:transposase [Polyangium sp. 15x6]|uniref:transposase n=1 Tax=Polyangium sp. 15x6 TaxID=3042687 RepID=UPI00249A5945|nr:transposase [Polyangium sp. 15x6]MDI3283450.1 transposase [Polyangium sp. 15x6]
MGRRSFQTIGAAGILAAMLSATIPACVIRIGPGGGDDSGSLSGGDSSGDNTGDNGEQTGGSQFTPEEQAAIDNLENADPDEAARTLLVSEYAGYAVAGFVESSGVDPADQATIDQLIDQYAPIAWQQAQEWVDTLDPSTIPLAGFYPKYACVEEYGCDYMQKCDFDNGTSAACIIVGCGKGACPICPKLWDLSNLVVKNWCLFTCQTGTGAIVGSKIVLNIALFGKRGRCMLLENPIP